MLDNDVARLKDAATNDAPGKQNASRRNSAADATARIVAAYVSYNRISPDDLIGLISSVGVTIFALSGDKSNRLGADKVVPGPAVPIKNSVTNDYMVCLEDGRKFRSLKRHLAERYGLTPDEYRTKWSLPADYPMVAPSYSKVRSELAKQSGLGRNRKGAGGS